MRRLVLIDADILCYRSGFAAQHTFYDIYDSRDIFIKACASAKERNEAVKDLVEGEYEVRRRLEVEPLSFCLNTVKRQIEKILEVTEADEYELYLTKGSTNFRLAIATILEYKGNRKDARRPVYYEEIREYLVRRWDAKIISGIEADDQLAIRLTEEGERAVCASIDKDLLQVPGYHHNFVTDLHKEVTKWDGAMALFSQMLTGDTSDNILGIPGIGKKGAELILSVASSVEEMAEVVQHEYDKYYKENGGPNWEPEDSRLAFEENAQLLYMLRSPEEYWSLERFLEENKDA